MNIFFKARNSRFGVFFPLYLLCVASASIRDVFTFEEMYSKVEEAAVVLQ